MKKVLATLAILAVTLSAQTIKVGVDPTYQPFEYVKDDKIVGFDIDMLAEIAKRVGFQYDLVIDVYDSIPENIANGKLDLGVSSFGKEEDFDKYVNYTRSYFDTKNFYIAKKDSGFNENTDLSGKKIGLITDTIESHIKEAVPAAKIVKADELNRIVLSLKAGRIDVIVIDSANVDMALNLQKDILTDLEKQQYELLEDLGQSSQLAIFKTEASDEPETVIVVPKNRNEELSKKIDAAIGDMINDGTLDKLFTKYHIYK